MDPLLLVLHQLEPRIFYHKVVGVNNASPQTISHGLTNKTPRFIIIKNLDQSYNWFVYHAGTDATAPEDYYLRLNTNNGRS